MKLTNRISPFIVAGIAIITLIFGMVLLAYLFIIGAAIGIVLFVINWVRENFFRNKKVKRSPKQPSGRIIDSDDWRKL